MEDNDFEFEYCPECGSTDLKWLYIVVTAGLKKKCNSCGKEWHVIFKNPEDFEEEGD